MPLYETVMQEKPPVVLDIGSAYTKLGFAAEPHPRKIIPSEVVLSTTGETKNVFEYTEEEEFYDQMVDFLQMVFFKHLLVSPKERKILVLENVLGKSIIRETIAKALFQHYEVASLLFVPSHMISLSTLGVNTGLVIDIGYNETTVMPVYSGVQIIDAYQDQNCGGYLLHSQIRQELLNNPRVGAVDEILLTERVLEDIKIRTCFVTTLERAQMFRNNTPPEEVPSIEYPIGNDKFINITGRLRETVYERMFHDRLERDSLAHLVLKTVLDCPIDCRKALMENIFVIGGGAIIMGLLPRLKEELHYLVKNDPEYKERFRGGESGADVVFKFHKTIGRQNFTAWLGGSLCAGTDLINTRSYTKETYMKTGRVPEWVNFTDTRSVGS